MPRSLTAALVAAGLLAMLAPPAGDTPARGGERAAQEEPTIAPDRARGGGGNGDEGSGALEALRDDILQATQAANRGRGEWGILAVSLTHGDTLVSLGARTPLTPASNQKLLTSAAALHHLGPDHRFATYLLASGPVRDGVLEGDLILYGTGDPTFSGGMGPAGRDALRAFARALRAEGIHTVAGRILGDGTFYEGPAHRDGWNSDTLNEWFAAPISALSFNGNVTTLRIHAGPVGAPPRVSTIPEGVELPVINRGSSVSHRPRSRLILMRDHPDEPVRLHGDLRRGGPDVWRVITVPDPPAYAASVFRRVLESEGMRVGTASASIPDRERSPVSAQRTVAPAFQGGGGAENSLRTLAVHHSPPLRDMLPMVNTESHNLYAELLHFAMGRLVEGRGSFDGGAAVLRSYLEEVVGADPEGLRVDDGSGLSRHNRLTAEALVRLLSHMAEAEHADLFWASLPVAGNRRGIGRMYRSPAAGNLRAKTGTIRGVSSLSGIVRTADGEEILFSLLANELPSSAAKRTEDRIGIRLASFARAWDPGSLADAVPAEERAPGLPLGGARD